MHNLSTVNTDTQGTTGTVTVVKNVPSGVGITHAVVSNGVVTTTATNGTGTTDFNCYDGYGNLMTNENRPNNISMNYIIKYINSGTSSSGGSSGGGASDSHITQTLADLNIENSYATSGKINFITANSSGTLTTPFNISSAGNTSTNLTVSDTINIQSTSNNTSLRLASDTGSKTNYIQSGSSQNTAVMDDLIFSSCYNGKSYVVLNGDGIQLQGSNGSCLYGRQDGFNFNSSNTRTGLYPVGYTWEFLGDLSQPVSNSNISGVIVSPTLLQGVWSITGYLVLNKGNGTYNTSSFVSVMYDNCTGCRIYPSSSGLRFPLASTNTTAQLVIPLGTINIVVTNNFVYQTMSPLIFMTVGSSTSWQFSFSGVKIA